MKQKDKQMLMTEKVRGDTKTFLSGVCVLSLSTVLVKVLGLASKIPLIGKLGAEGMGYFNSAYEVYALLCVISTAGLPTALSILVSGEDRTTPEGSARIDRIYRSTFGVFALLGLFGTAFLLFGSTFLSNAIKNPNARSSVLAIAPALLCVCVASAVRGYFQGLQRMTPTAISQLIEAVGKLVFGVFFAERALKRGADVSVAAAWAVLGISLGCLLSAVYLLICKWTDNIRKKRFSQAVKKVDLRREAIKNLLKIAIPITLSSAVISMTRLVDMAMMIRRLQDVGLTAVEANRIYGAYTTLAVPVFSLLPSLITPISLALIPQLNSAVGRGSKDGQKMAVETSCRLTVLLAMPASMGIVLFSDPILSLLFSEETAAVSLCAPLLSVLGMSVLFSGLITTTNAILQSYRKVWFPILSMSVGVLVKAVSSYFLMGIPGIGAMGAPISTFFCNITVTAMNFWFITRNNEFLSDGFGRIFLRPLLPSTASVLGAFAIYLLLRETIGKSLTLLVAILVALILYFFFSVWFGAIRQEDLRLLPFGEKMMRKIKSNLQ